MTAVAPAPELIAVMAGNKLSFPCASCGAEITVTFKCYDVPGMPPTRVNGHCQCEHAYAWVIDLDGHYVRPPNRALGIRDVEDAQRARDAVWFEWREALDRIESYDTYATSMQLDRRCLLAYMVCHETLRQALADAEDQGYARGLEAGKRARSVA